MDLPKKDQQPLEHAKWLQDAMEASKQAAEYAKSYPALEQRDWEMPCDERAVAFHEKNSKDGGNVEDAILNAMRWHIPPDQMRDVETAMQTRELQRKMDHLKSELEQAKFEVAMWREMAMRADKSEDNESDEDYD